VSLFSEFVETEKFELKFSNKGLHGAWSPFGIFAEILIIVTFGSLTVTYSVVMCVNETLGNLDFLTVERQSMSNGKNGQSFPCRKVKSL
jgi:hypothetical protein